jgi:hypothetical protein
MGAKGLMASIKTVLVGFYALKGGRMAVHS